MTDRVRELRRRIMCGEYPTDEMVDAAIDEMIRRGAMDEPPLVMGGQGRSDEDVLSSARCLGYVATLAAMLVIAATAYMVLR